MNTINLKKNEMKKLTLAFFLLSSIIYSQNTVSNLIIEKGQTKKLIAGSYNYNRIHIKSGATLEFMEESSNWVVLNSKDFILEGNVIFKRFKRGIGNIKTTTNDGFILEYNFPENSIGGNGGNGGCFGGLFKGKGYKTKNQNGGGGGSGSQETVNMSSHGDDAIKYQGAQAGLSKTYSCGGDGGESNNNHGGLLYINTINFKSNENSWIFLNGENGEKGENGKDGQFLFNDEFSGGGGGGGSAGGDGGVLIVRATRYINERPKVNVAGGFGGFGGKGGETFQTWSFGLNGEKGENGKNGYINWLQK